jgi:hypothetical protein
MAAIDAIAQTAEVALAGATAKTVIQIVAPANQRLRVKSWGVSFDGTSETNAPVEVVLMRQSTAGTMSALTPVNKGVGTETLQVTAQHTATAEPTSGNILDAMEVHPQSGYEKVYVPGSEVLVPGGGRLGVVCTAPDAVNVRAKIEYEE